MRVSTLKLCLKTSTILTFAVAASLAGAAMAQSAPPAGDQSSSVEEVVVTAQKRTENLQTVPVAITVVTGNLLRQNGISNAESLQQVVPSLTFKKGTTNLNSTLSIRGIGTQSFAAGAEPSVSTVVDGVVMGRSGMAFSEFTDIARVEVLRGPQGALFGKNAGAGVVSIVTRDPSNSFMGDASIGWFQGNEIKASGTISGPIGEHSGFVLSALYGDYRGNIRNVFDNSWTNGYTRYGLRGKFVTHLGDSFKLTLAADYVHADDNCCADVIGTYIPSPQLTNVFLPSIAPVAPGPHNMSVDNDLPPKTTDTNMGASIQADWDVGGGYTLTSITAYREWKNFQQRDGDFHSGCCNYVASLDLTQHDHGSLDFKQYSEEVRFTSPANQFFSYVIGAFFWHTDQKDNFTRSDRQCTASTLPADATGFQPCSAAPGVSTFLVTSGTANFDTQFDNMAGFGQATINVNDRFRLIGGGRFTHDRVSYTFARVDNPVPGPGIGAPFASVGATSASGWSTKLGAQYDVTPDVMAYATYSKGYKGPALNVFFNMSAANLTPVPPETSRAYEVGLKSTLFDHHLVLNMDVFSQTFANFQANSFVNLGGSVVTNLTNAGNVRSRGFELDATWRPMHDLSFTGGYTFNDAKILNYYCPASLAPAQFATCIAHNGKLLPFAPRNKFNITGDWRLPLGESMPFHADLISSYVYTSTTNFDIDQTPLARQPGYGLWNASLVLASPDDRYALTLIARNITNQFYVDFVTPVGNGVTAGSFTRLQIPRDAQRYVGAQLSMKF